MGFLVILPFAAVAGWAIWRIYRWLHSGNFGPDWHRRFLKFVLAGGALGIWFAFFAAYNVASKRIEGFPIPSAIWSRDKPADPLVRSVLPLLIRVPAVITDVLCGVALCLAPLALAAFIKENKGHKDFAGPRGGLSG